MKKHFCPAEQSTITYQGKCNWCGEREALAQTEQEPVAWLEPEWGEKICPEVGYEVTMTDDHPRDLCWIPLYAHPPQGEPVAWQLWVGADTPLNAPMGWQFYSTYDSLKSAEVSARTINSYQQAPFAKLVPLYTTPPQRTDQGTQHMNKYEQIKGMANPNKGSVGVQEAQPPQRTWVGLTNNELQPIADEYRILFGSWVEDFARAIEAELKEKNDC